MIRGFIDFIIIAALTVFYFVAQIFLIIYSMIFIKNK